MAAQPAANPIKYQTVLVSGENNFWALALHTQKNTRWKIVPEYDGNRPRELIVCVKPTVPLNVSTPLSLVVVAWSDCDGKRSSTLPLFSYMHRFRRQSLEEWKQRLNAVLELLPRLPSATINVQLRVEEGGHMRKMRLPQLIKTITIRMDGKSFSTSREWLCSGVPILRDFVYGLYDGRLKAELDLDAFSCDELRFLRNCMKKMPIRYLRKLNLNEHSRKMVDHCNQNRRVPELERTLSYTDVAKLLKDTVRDLCIRHPTFTTLEPLKATGFKIPKLPKRSIPSDQTSNTTGMNKSTPSPPQSKQGYRISNEFIPKDPKHSETNHHKKDLAPKSGELKMKIRRINPDMERAPAVRKPLPLVTKPPPLVTKPPPFVKNALSLVRPHGAYRVVADPYNLVRHPRPIIRKPRFTKPAAQPQTPQRRRCPFASIDPNLEAEDDGYEEEEPYVLPVKRLKSSGDQKSSGGSTQSTPSGSSTKLFSPIETFDVFVCCIGSTGDFPTKEAIIQYFERFGRVYSCIYKERCCTIEYTDLAQATAAAESFEHVVDGITIIAAVQ